MVGHQLTTEHHTLIHSDPLPPCLRMEELIGRAKVKANTWLDLKIIKIIIIIFFSKGKEIIKKKHREENKTQERQVIQMGNNCSPPAT